MGEGGEKCTLKKLDAFCVGLSEELLKAIDHICPPMPPIANLTVRRMIGERRYHTAYDEESYIIMVYMIYYNGLL